MKKNLTARQMINVELMERDTNTKSSKVLKNHIPKEEQHTEKLLFNCECADPDCNDRIALTIHEYEQLHRKSSRFVIVRGHSEPKVEKVEATSKNLAVVDKYAL